MANCDELEESENAVLSISVHPQDQHRITIGDTPTTEVFIIGKGGIYIPLLCTTFLYH